MLPPVIIALHIIYTGYQRVQQDRDAWRMLDAANGDLNRGEEEQVVRAALAWAERMFNTTGAALWLRGDGLPLGAPESAGIGQWAIWRRELGEVTHAQRSSPSELVNGAREVLKVREGTIGMLDISLPVGSSLTERERHLFTAFADAVSSHLVNARLLSRQVHEATHDGLTGLGQPHAAPAPVRRRARAAHRRRGGRLLLLDLDRFKQVNDTLGHAVGDVLLQQVSERLSAQVRREDLVARLGGDEFGILLTGIATADDAEVIADALLGALNEPFLLEGLRVSVGGSIGVAVCPVDSDHVEACSATPTWRCMRPRRVRDRRPATAASVTGAAPSG